MEKCTLSQMSNISKKSVIFTCTNKPYVQNLIVFEIRLLLTDVSWEFDLDTK